jgi:type IV secretory pathway TraG/TraD family ATPase VirD4
MSNNALTDAGVGRALFTTRFGLSLQAAMMCLWFGAIPGFILPMLIWSYRSDPHEFDVGKTEFIAQHFASAESKLWRVRTPDGQRGVMTVTLADGRYAQKFNPPQIIQVLERFEKPALTAYRNAKLASLLLGVGAYIALWIALKRFGAGSQDNKRVRGAADLVTSSELTKLVVSTKGVTSRYKVVGVRIPDFSTVMGILMQGAQRSGKSIAMHDLMRQVMKAGKKCVIYDQNGEFFRAYYRPGKDLFFNPALEGSVNWSIFKELKYSFDSDTLAEAFLPPKGGVVSGPGAFFEDAARALFSVIVRRLAERGATNTSDIARAFLDMPDEEMAHLIEKSVASSAIGGDSKGQRQGVISSIAIYLTGIQAVQPGTWSVRDFIDGPDDARLFLLGTEDTKAMFTPLFRLIIAVAFNAIAAKQEVVRKDKYWFFLDEVNQLGDVKIDQALATLGKFGVSVVAGIQSDSQFITSIGKDRADVVMNCFNSVLMLLANEPNMQKRMAERIGRVEMDTVNRNQALAVTEWRDGAGLNRSENEKWTVMPSEFGALAPLTGFLKLAGQYPVAKVDYRDWLRPSLFGLIPAKVAANAEKQKTPDRLASFVISRAEHEDALRSVKEEVAAKKAEEAEAVETAKKGSGGLKLVKSEPTTEQEKEGDAAEVGAVSVGDDAAQMNAEQAEPDALEKRNQDDQQVQNLASMDLANMLRPD